MTLDEFRKSLTATEPPAGLTLALAGLWWDGKGDWTRAHESGRSHGYFWRSAVTLTIDPASTCTSDTQSLYPESTNCTECFPDLSFRRMGVRP